MKTPLDEAILAHRHIPIDGWVKIDEVPFDFERRCISVLLDTATQRMLVVKGAPDDILSRCAFYEVDGVEQEIDAAALATIQARYHALEQEGFRVLGIAWRRVGSDHPHAVVADETELVLAGFAAFLDPPKASAASALQALQRVGVEIKIVTGDSDLVTRHVCEQLKISVTGLLTGKEIALMDEPALRVAVGNANLFCRVNPAPSLHSADVSLSVDSAVDVAKEAADMILLKHELHVINAAVLEGRRTFGNIVKYIMMGTSSNFGNMFSMAGAALFLPFFPMLPMQILLNNILYDISEIAIPLDKVDAVEVRRPSVIDLSFIRNFMLVVGPISSLFDFLTFYVILGVMVVVYLFFVELVMRAFYKRIACLNPVTHKRSKKITGILH